LYFTIKILKYYVYRNISGEYFLGIFPNEFKRKMKRPLFIFEMSDVSDNNVYQHRISALWGNPIGLIAFKYYYIFHNFEKKVKLLKRPFPSRPTPRPLRPTPPLPPFLSFN